ncbi:unnamed protein product [Staurois parvus]|uniref:Vacuolar-sorting protein SNF8 n=1 Tax=Staurois parvus TaxID=386267 RepID=A0ABN9EHL1_9NEOB|nr:unnamed protein product [Staurois parvus]
METNHIPAVIYLFRLENKSWRLSDCYSSILCLLKTFSLCVSLFLGLITLAELHQQVLKGRGKLTQDVSQDDIIRAIKKLKVLGSGFGIIPVGGSYLVQSVPAELNMDHTVVLQLAEKKGYVTVGEIQSSLNWEKERAKHVLEHLLKEGLAWLDLQADGDPQYWLPALFTELYSEQISPEESSEGPP